MQGDGKAIKMTKGKRMIIFDIVIHTMHGALFCACFKRNGTETCGSTVENETKMSVHRAHALLGHTNENKTGKTAKYLDWELSRGELKPCEDCALAKAKQKNVPKSREGSHKATKPNEHIYHNIATEKHLKS
jgi:hypothetical protein